MRLSNYFSFSKTVMSMMSAYRLEFMVWIILSPLGLLIKYYIWKAVFEFNAGGTIAGYTFETMLAYYAIMYVMGSIVFSDEDLEMSRSVNSGDISIAFTKPFSIFLIDLFNGFGTNIFAIIFEMVPMALIIFFLFKIKTAGLVFTVLSIISFFIAHLLNYTLSFTFGLSSFWLKDYYGVGKAKNVIVDLMSGSFMPLDIFPVSLKNIFENQPFAYIYFYPAKIFIGNFSVNECFFILIKQLAWLGIFYLISVLAWKKATEKFTGEGI